MTQGPCATVEHCYASAYSAATGWKREQCDRDAERRRCGGEPTPAGQPCLQGVYDELHRLAHRERRAQGRDLTLNTTALVHETWLKLRVHVGGDASAGQFFSLAARAMRQILVDYARRRHARKRGGDFTWTELSDDLADGGRALSDVIALDRALDALERVDPELGALGRMPHLRGPGDGRSGSAARRRHAHRVSRLAPRARIPA